MRVFIFFVKKIFFRKIINLFSVFLLIFFSSYIIFISSRSTISAMQGHEEMNSLNKQSTYIANLDPNESLDFGNISEKAIDSVYKDLDNSFEYALFTDGFIQDISNEYNMPVSFAYTNQSYFQLNRQFQISEGTPLRFDYSLIKGDDIPVWIGEGLSHQYPISSKIEIIDPALNKKVVFRVVGILKKDISHSNMYALSSKQYYNFSIIVPINQEFIKLSTKDLKLQILFDLILFNTTKEKVEKLGNTVKDRIGIKLNFFTQEENFLDFNGYYWDSMIVLVIVTLILIFLVVILAVWNALSSLKLMIRDFTINLFVGMSYSLLRRILYTFYGFMILLQIFVIYLITLFSRLSIWNNSNPLFVTFGFGGLIVIDWSSLAIVLAFDFAIIILIVEILMSKIRKIPISLGVMI